MDVEYMESIAKVRFGLCTAAEYFFEYYWKEDEYQNLNRAEKDQLKTLTLHTKDVCQERCVKSEPRYFLAKQLVRQFGFPCLYKLSQHNSWINPVGKLEKGCWKTRNAQEQNGTERSGTEPEIIDAQYGRGRRIHVGKLVLIC